MNNSQLFLDLSEADQRTYVELVTLAKELKAAPDTYTRTLLQGKVLYGLYQKTSTRTHLSFGAAMARLGGAYVWQSWADSNFSISDIPNESRYVSTTADAMVARLLHYGDAKLLAGSATIPFINGCCNKFHPPQVMTDLLTIHETAGAFENVRVLYVGVLNNVLNSLMLALPTVGAKLTAIVLRTNPMAHDAALIERVEQRLEGTGQLRLLYEPTPELLRREIEQTDFVYLDTWTDMEFAKSEEASEDNKSKRHEFAPFQLNADTYGNSQALIMHCMPVHVGYEIEQEMIDHPRSVVFQQAGNRLHAQCSMLMWPYR